MLKISLGAPRSPLRLLCVGAHSDDIEIGCGGTIRELLSMYSHVEVTWVVLCAQGPRATEARDSARALLRNAKQTNLLLCDFRDGYLPAQFSAVKARFQDLETREEPDIILTHYLHDRHQDHRLSAELTWQTFRNHLVLEYEIPKYEGDLGQPNFFVPLSGGVSEEKAQHLMQHFGSQRSKDWFRPETFMGLMGLRGVECRANSGYAEAFHVRKAVL